MATAIYPKIKLNTSKPPLGGVVSSASAASHAIPRPSPTPSKTLPSPTMTTAIAVSTPVNGNSSAASNSNNVRTSERRRNVPNKFGSDGNVHTRIKKDRGADIDEDGDTLALNQPPRKKLKPMPRGIPTVITTQYILDKYKDKPPSLTLHMHPTHFRFDQQDGTFNYNSAMRSILEYIAQETIPADAVEVFRDARIPFYEGRLIVHIHDHRTTAKDVDGASVKPKNDMLFSLNKWNDHLTPSPFVPYPAHKNEIKEEPPANDEVKPMEVDSSSSKPEESKKVYKTVLHPTPASLHAEICLLALTPVPPNARGRHGSVAQTPATPASANPLTISTTTTNKSHPTILNDKTALTFEADYLLTTGPSLVLTPAESPEHAAAILDALAHPLHSRPVPPKKTRKRTVKEMAVDEAQAAEEERLMLIMDERHQASSIGAPDDGLVGSGSFEPSFKRWKTLESIKQKHEEEKIQKAQEQRAAQEKERQKALKDQQQSRASSEVQTRVTAGTPTEQSPLEGKGTLREIIQRGGAAQQHLAQQRAQEQAAREAREQQAQATAAAQAQAAAQAREREQAQAAQAAQQAAQQQQAREKAAAANHAAQVAAQQQAQAVAAQTPTSAPQQTTATQGSPIAAASSPFAHHGSPSMPSRTSNHSSQPGSRQQSPHISTVQSIQHQHAQPMPGSPAMHPSPMMRTSSQAMHGSPAMNQGSPLARNITMVGNQHNLSPAQIAAHQMMMANAARNQGVNMGKNPGQQMHTTPEAQKVMMQRAFILQQQQHAFRQQQILANQAAAAHAAQQQNQQHGMMDGMNVAAGMHPGMAGRGFMAGMVPANGMHMNGMMGGMQMGMNGYPQMMAPNGMGAAGGIPMGMMNGAALQGYNPAQINMMMAARGRGQPPQGQ
ncbi:hypothetical protein AA313_de0206691 [Arthrobotrys entomopaga]|nr:hypothetical protein AA313_de0206691 [Arthrobotrys entomopaga]